MFGNEKSHVTTFTLGSKLSSHIVIWPTWHNPVFPLWGKGHPQQFSIWVGSWLLFLLLSRWYCTSLPQRLCFVSRWLLVYLFFFFFLEDSNPKLVFWCYFGVPSECFLSSPISWWCWGWMTGLFLSILLSSWSSLAIWFVELFGGICLQIFVVI